MIIILLWKYLVRRPVILITIEKVEDLHEEREE